MRFKHVLMFCLTLIIWSALAGMAAAEQAAGQTSLDEVVVTATRSEEKVKEIPAKVEVIGKQEIEVTTGETITEQLKKNSSIGVIEYPGALAGIGIRGFRPEFFGITKHSLVLIDGRPAGATNLATILVDNIERIEVLKGPASALYGGEAMGGVINIITRKNRGQLTGQVEAGLGSFRTNFEKAAIGGSLGKKFDFDVSARRYEQADDFTMGNGEVRPNTEYLTQNANLRLGFDLNDAWRLGATTDIYQGRDIETPGDIVDGDQKAGHKDIDRYSMALSAEGDLSASNQISLNIYSAREESENYKHYTGWIIITQVTPYRSYDSETTWTGVQLKDRHDWRSHRFIFGIDYQDIVKESRNYNQDGSRKAPWSPDEGRTNWAGYLETVWRFMEERLTVTAGARYDYFEVETKPTPFKTDFTPKTEDFSTTSPRAGINYLFDNGLRLHTTIGKAFVPPTAGQLAGYSERVVGGVTMVTRGNPDLDPESSVTYDAGIGYDLPVMGLSLDLTYFHTDVDDKITRVTNGTVTTYENSLSAEMEGLEYMLSFDIGAPLQWDRTLALFFNGTTMLKAEEEQPDHTMKDIHNVADYTYNYGIRYDDGTFSGKLHLRTQGEMKDTDWNAAGYPEIEYPGFTVVDFAAGVKFAKYHKFTLKIDNLFDDDYYEKKGFPKPGRAFFLSYRFQF